MNLLLVRVASIVGSAYVLIATLGMAGSYATVVLAHRWLSGTSLTRRERPPPNPRRRPDDHQPARGQYDRPRKFARGLQNGAQQPLVSLSLPPRQARAQANGSSVPCASS